MTPWTPAASAVQAPSPRAPKRPTPVATLGVARHTEHLGVETDAGGLEEDLPMHLRGIRPRHASPRDDLRGLDRLQRETETVRDIHDAPERQDPEDDRAVQKRGGRERDGPVAAGDDARLVAMLDRAAREIVRARRLRACLHPIQDEAGALEDGLAAFEIAGFRVTVTGGRIGDQQRANTRTLVGHGHSW